jgi:Flp pilus assembly protein TadD
MMLTKPLHADLAHVAQFNWGSALLVMWALTGCSQTTAPLPDGKPVKASAQITQQATQQSVTQQTATPLSAEQLQQFEQAKVQLGAGEYSAAAQSFSLLYVQLPKAPGVGYNLALSQWQGGDISSAQHTLEQVVSVAPQYSNAHNLLGVLARQQGQFRQAERHFQSALQAQSDNAAAHKNLAVLYELYLGVPLQAHFHYKQYYALTQDEQAKVWLALLDQQLEQSNE